MNHVTVYQKSQTRTCCCVSGKGVFVREDSGWSDGVEYSGELRKGHDDESDENKTHEFFFKHNNTEYW